MSPEKFYRKWLSADNEIDLNEAAKATGAITEANGNKFQCLIACEECGELIQAISKCQRNFDAPGITYEEKEALRMHLIEEMADMLFMIGAMRYNFCISREDIAKALNVKIDYSKEVIEKEFGTQNPVDSY